VPKPADRAAVAESVRASLAALPGITNAVQWGGCGLHFGEWHSDLTGVPAFTDMVDERCVGQDFFKMYGVRLLRGRQFEPGDPEGTAIVGERIAAALWPNQDPIGHSMTIDQRRFTVVGVASEMNRPTLDQRNDYADLYSILKGGQTISLRCAAACPSEGMIRQHIRSASALATPFSFKFLEQVYAEDLAQPRATAAIGVVFSAIALMAVAGGLFGVLTHAVNRRRREFGVRAALGASPSQLRWTVLGDGLFVAGLGISIGGVAGWLLMRLLTSLQYGVSPTDPMSWTIVVATLVLTTVVAAWRPSRQAMRSDPATLLRQD
jgi:putative ABC transport system permease protein